MDLDADAVAGAVAEVLAVARLRDHVAAGLVEVEGRDVRTDIVETRLLRFPDGLIDVDHLFGRLADREGAGGVGMVVLVQGAEVDRDEVTGLDEFLTGHAVGLRGVGTADRDGVEGDAVRAELPHEVLEFVREVPLRDTGFQDVEQFVQRLLGDVLGPLHLFDLFLTLDLPDAVRQLVKPIRDVEGVGGEHFAPLVEFGQGHPVRLDEDLRAVVFLQEVEDLLVDLVLKEDLRLGHRAAGRLIVPAVRDERALFRHDQKGAVGRRKPGEVETVLLAEDERRLCRLELRRKSCNIHVMFLSYVKIRAVSPTAPRPVVRAFASGGSTCRACPPHRVRPRCSYTPRGSPRGCP